MQGHGIAQCVAHAGQGQDVDFDEVLLGHPVLGQERPAGADAGAVDQQVDLSLTLFELQQKAGQAQRLAQVTGAKQYLDAEALGQFQCNAFQLITLAGHQNQATATPCQGFGQCQADATGGAGDQSVTGHAFLHRNAAGP